MVKSKCGQLQTGHSAFFKKKSTANKCFKQTKVNGKERVYELTTNAKDGFSKWMVRGIKDDFCAKKISRSGFGKFSEPKLISYYDDYPSEYGTDWKKAPSIKNFLNKTSSYRK